MPGVPHVVELGIIMEPYYGSVRENFQIVMFPGISSKVLIVLSKYSISKENPIPIINPRILSIVENDIKPKLCRDRKCRNAMRFVSLIILPDVELEKE